MEQKWLAHNNKNIMYRAAGAGTPVVLLHGFGEDGTIWRHQVNALAPYRLIIPDLPGSGASEMIDDMSMEGLADCIMAILEQEHIDRCVMIGHSMGGYITLAFAERHAERLTGFGLFHSTAYADSEEKKETRRKGIAFIRQHGAYEFLKTATPNLYAPLSKEQKSHLINEHLNSVRNFSVAALVSYYESMIRRPDRTRVLKETRLPVLFVMGRHDTAVPLQDGLQQCHMPQLSYIHILEDSGHMGMIEEPGKSNTLLQSYIPSCKTTSGQRQ